MLEWLQTMQDKPTGNSILYDLYILRNSAIIITPTIKSDGWQLCAYISVCEWTTTYICKYYNYLDVYTMLSGCNTTYTPYIGIRKLGIILLLVID